MKRIFILLLLTALFSSCGVSLNSVAEESESNRTYSNPLVVIPYEKYGPRNFSKKLKAKMEAQFQAEGRNVEIFVIELKNDNSLSLNQENEVDQKISNTINNKGKDLLLVVQPKNLIYNNGSLQVADYQLTGIDTFTGDEVWKATFRSRSYFGPAFFADKTARLIFEQLKTDKIL